MFVGNFKSHFAMVVNIAIPKAEDAFLQANMRTIPPPQDLYNSHIVGVRIKVNIAYITKKAPVNCFSTTSKLNSL